MLKRRRKNPSKNGRPMRSKSFKTISCSKKGCNRKVDVDNDCESVICWECVSKMVGIDPKYLRPQLKVVKKETGFPRGWHLYKRFVHPDGRVFELGKENAELKGTLPTTEVKVSTLTKTQRRRLREEKQLRKESRLAKRHAKKMKSKEAE